MFCCLLIGFILASIILVIRFVKGCKPSESWHPSDSAFRGDPASKRRLPFGINHALRGIQTTIKTEFNMRLHIIATISAIILAAATHPPIHKWPWLLLAIALVWICELLNTAIENCCDAITQQTNIQIRDAKDTASAAVLIAAIFAIIIGVYVFCL